MHDLDTIDTLNNLGSEGGGKDILIPSLSILHPQIRDKGRQGVISYRQKYVIMDGILGGNPR
jgi:hypothetical protein